MGGLERVEGHFLGRDINFLTVNVNEVNDISVSSVPSLIYFKNGEPFVYEGREYIAESFTESFKKILLRMSYI
jgi:hypothetical protein